MRGVSFLGRYCAGKYRKCPVFTINYLKRAVTITVKDNLPDNAANFAALLSSIYMKQKNMPVAKLYVEIARDEAYKSNDISNYQVVYADAI